MKLNRQLVGEYADAYACHMVTPAPASQDFPFGSSHTPPPEILWPVRHIIQFQQTGDSQLLRNVFFDGKVLIVDSFAPYIFHGTTGIQSWVELFSAHVSHLQQLTATPGIPQEFSQEGPTAYFSQPILWKYRVATEKRLTEEVGGLAAVLSHTPDGWRVRALTWAVTATSGIQEQQAKQRDDTSQSCESQGHGKCNRSESL